MGAHRRWLLFPKKYFVSFQESRYFLVRDQKVADKPRLNHKRTEGESLPSVCG